MANLEQVAPPGNDPIMWERSIWSFRHPEHQNQSIILDSIDLAGCGKIISSNLSHHGGIGATFKNSKTVDWRGLSKCFYKNLKNWNLPSNGYFRRVYIFGNGWKSLD